jgi:hypothetical protein
MQRVCGPGSIISDKCSSSKRSIIRGTTGPLEASSKRKKTGWLALWLEHLTPEQEDMSSNLRGGKELATLTSMWKILGQVFYTLLISIVHQASLRRASWPKKYKRYPYSRKFFKPTVIAFGEIIRPQNVNRKWRHQAGYVIILWRNNCFVSSLPYNVH